MPTVSLTDYTTQASDIERRRKMADMLQQESMKPLATNEMAGGYVLPISWTQGLAKALQGYAGMQGQRKATEESQALSQSRNQALAQALGGMPTGTPGTAGVPEQNFTPEAADFADNPNLAPNAQGQVNVPAQAGAQAQPPTTQDYAGWLGKLSGIGPDATAIGSSLMAQQLKKDEPYTLPEGGQRRGDGGALIGENPKDFRPPVVAPIFKQVGAAGNKVQDQISRDGGVTWNNVGVPTDKFAPPNPNVIHNNNPAPVTPVTIANPDDPTGQSTIIIDGRTKAVLGQGPKLTQTGSVDLKLSQNQPQAQERVNLTVQNLDSLEKNIQALHDDPGLSRITGTVAGRTPNITNTATGAQNQLDNIKAKIFVSALQSMREASKTGGAVGNVSDREGEKLQNTLAGLNQAAGTPDFKKALKLAIEQVQTSRAISRTDLEAMRAALRQELMQKHGRT